MPTKKPIDTAPHGVVITAIDESGWTATPHCQVRYEDEAYIATNYPAEENWHPGWRLHQETYGFSDQDAAVAIVQPTHWLDPA